MHVFFLTLLFLEFSPEDEDMEDDDEGEDNDFVVPDDAAEDKENPSALQRRSILKNVARSYAP